VNKGLAICVALHLSWPADSSFPQLRSAFGANCNKAQASLHQSESDTARNIYNWLPASDSVNLHRTTNPRLAHAIILAPRFQKDHMPALGYRQYDFQDANKYTPASAGDTSQLAVSVAAWLAALQSYRNLAVKDPDEYTPLVAVALINLGDAYEKSGQLAEAEKALSDALTIDRNLADRSPLLYKPTTAMILVKIGNLFSSTEHPAEAVKAYREARSIYSDLASRDPIYSYQIEPLTKRLAELNAKISTRP